MHYSARLTGLVAAVLAAACGAAPAAAAPVRTGSLQVADLSSRTVEVSMSRNGEHAPREGTVGLLVRNRANGPRRLRVRYTAAESGDSFTVWGVARSPRHRERPEQPLDTPGGMVVPVSARDVVDLHVTFTALADATPDELVGRLVIVPERRQGRRVRGAPLILRIRGARAEERHVVVSPSKVTVPTTLAVPNWSASWPWTWDPLTESVTDRGYVDLRGPGAAALLRRKGPIDVVLRRDDGHSVTVPIGIEALGDNAARLLIPAPGEKPQVDDPGRYTGSLPLGSGPAAPAVALTLDVQVWWLWAVAVVLLGVIVGRMVPPLLSRQRQRRRAQDAVADALARFSALRRGRDEPASYDIDDVITPLRWKLRGLFVRPQDDLSRLVRTIDDATTDPALEEARVEAVAVRAKVDAWATYEQAARRLSDLLDGTLPKRPSAPYVSAPMGPRTGSRGAATEFSETLVYRAAEAVLAKLRDDPKDAPDEALLVRADRECRVVRLASDVWQLRVKVEAADGFEPNWDPGGVFAIPTDPALARAAARDALAYDVLVRRLEREQGDLRAEVRKLGKPHVATRLGRFLGRAGHRVLDALKLAASNALEQAQRLRRAASGRVHGWVTFAELFTVLLSLAVPAAVYVLTLYNGAWGSPLDILSAFAVGFAGKVAIDFGTSGIKVHDDTGDAPGKKPPPIKAPPIVEQRRPDADVPVGANN